MIWEKLQRVPSTHQGDLIQNGVFAIQCGEESYKQQNTTNIKFLFNFESFK